MQGLRERGGRGKIGGTDGGDGEKGGRLRLRRPAARPHKHNKTRQRDVRHVDAAAGDVGGDEHVEGALPETLDAHLARVLRLAAVQRRAPAVGGGGRGLLEGGGWGR